MSGDDTAVLARLLGEPVARAERVGQGRNSRVYQVRCGSGEYAAKFYFHPTAEGRDRLQAEYGALTFLWGAGVRCIPRPVRADAAGQVAVYELVKGASIGLATLSARDLDQVVDFARELKVISGQPASAGIGDAAEAFFSIDGVIRNIASRLERLAALDLAGTGYDALRAFLRDRFRPRFAELKQRAVSTAGGGAPGVELDPRHRTLSPSDFGFHNALRRGDGSLVFLDFEYFGWDDPAKLLSDLLLHPMMALGQEQRRRLVQGLDRVFGADASWRARVEALYPLFGLKWCMIMLNEFLPSHIARNRFTERDSAQIEAVQRRQLHAAVAMLERITAERGRFPYWGSATG